MLESLDQLLELVKSDYASSANLEPYHYSNPVLTELEAEELIRELPDLPEDYINVAKRMAFHGNFIRNFALWPTRGVFDSLRSSIIELNKDECISATLSNAGAYEIAEREGEGYIGIIRKGNESAGTIIITDVYNPSEPPVSLAASFEKFVLLAFNLALHVGHFQGHSITRDEFGLAVERFAGSESAANLWMQYADCGDIAKIDPGLELYNQATALIKEERFEEALAKLEQISDIHYKNFERMGFCLEKLGRENEAIAYYSAATILNSNFVAPSRLMDIFTNLKDLAAAANVAKICLLRDPKHRKSLSVLEALSPWPPARN